MFYILNIFTLVAFAEAEWRLCSTNVVVICPEPDNPPHEYIPGNIQELRSYCSSTKDYVECLNSYDLACKDRSAYFVGLDEPLYYKTIISLLIEACDERSSMYQVLASKLPCIKRRVDARNLACSEQNKIILDAYEYYRRHRLRLDPEEKRKQLDCLEIISTTACVLKSIEEECGYKAYQTASHFVLRSQVMAEKCYPTAFFALQSAVEELDLDFHTKKLLKKYLQVHIE